MTLLFIGHGPVGRRTVTRLGMLGMAVAPALDLRLEDALAAASVNPPTGEVGAVDRLAAEAPLAVAPADESIVETPRPESPASGPPVARMQAALALACLVSLQGHAAVEEGQGQGRDEGPFSRASYAACDLMDDTEVATLRTLLVDYVEHELRQAREPGLLLLFDLRTADGVSAAKRLQAAADDARAQLPTAFLSRRVLVVNILPDMPSAEHAELVEPAGWGAVVTLELSDHTADEADHERLETDESLGELVALLASAAENRRGRAGMFEWRAYDETDDLLRHAAVGIRAVVAGQDMTDAATQLARGMAATCTQKENERVPIGMDPVMNWPAQIGLDSGPLVERLLERPSAPGVSPDMRDAFGKPQPPVWTALDAGRWVITLRDLRRRSLLSPGIALSEWARANADEWRVEILSKLSGLVDRVIEHGFLALPDAGFVLGEFDEAVSRATVEGALRHPEGCDFDRALGGLRAELEDLPHAEAIRTRFGLAGAAAALPLALILPGILSGLPGIAIRIGALLLGLVVGLVVAASYQRSREKRLTAVRDRALASLGAWLIADLERLVVVEVSRGVAQLREAMAEEHLPAIERLISTHTVAERALEVAAAYVPSGLRVKSISELTGVEVPPGGEPDPQRVLRQFMDGTPGRHGWRTLTPLDVGRRLLGYAREAVLPAASGSLEGVMAEVFTVENRAEVEARIQDFLGGADRERAIDGRRIRGWSGETYGLLLTSVVDAPIWNDLVYGEHAFAWDPERQMALSLRLEWKEKG